VNRFLLCVLLFCLGILVACGGNSSSVNTPPPPPPPPVTLKSMAVTTTSPSIAPGTTAQFVATGTFSDNTTQVLTTSVTWTSSDTTKATISNSAGTNGLAKAVAAGSVTIKATSGSVAGTMTLTVTNATLSSVAVTPASPTVDFGAQQQFTATGSFSDGSTQDISNICNWTSSASAIASVTARSGLASAKSPGLANISAACTVASVTAPTASTVLTVSMDNLASISITPGTAQIAQGTATSFAVTGLFNDGRTANLTSLASGWASSNTSVATVNGNGQATAAASVASASNTTISVNVNRTTLAPVSATATLTVTNATLSSLDVAPSGSSLQIGAQLKFSALGTFSDATTQNLTNLANWASDNTPVATVNNASGTKGTATGVAAGTANITAAMLGVTSPLAALTVTGATLSSIALTTSGNPFTAPGGTVQYIATGTYSDGTTQNVTLLATWTSSDNTVATINQNGFATGQGAGSATITAKVGSVSQPTTLVVTPSQLVSLTVTSPNSSSKLAEQTFVQLKAIGNFADGSTQDLTNNVVWTSSTSSVATVGSSTGVVAGIAGTASGNPVTITASFGNVTPGTIQLSVTNATLQSIAISPTSASITLGNGQQFNATGTFSDGSAQILSTFANWSSSNTGVALVNSSGFASSNGKGSTTITGAFTQNSITHSGTATLTVN
jgi:trimeric autotransporter adhesin